MEQSSNKSRAFLSKLDDQQLRQILLAEVESDDTDVDLIRNITAVLESRDHTETEIDAQKAYQSFVEEHAKGMPLYGEHLKKDDFTKKRKPVRISRLARIGIVAAIIFSLIIVTTGIASAAGIDLWGAFTRWTEKTFGVTKGDSVETDDFVFANDACEDIRQMLTKNGVYEDVVPNYLPQGYTILDSLEQKTYEGIIISAVYRNGSSEILFLYQIGTGDISNLYPKDEDTPLAYERGGVSHYIFENEGEWAAVWQKANIGAQISGVNSKEELLNILNSIYEGK